MAALKSRRLLRRRSSRIHRRFCEFACQKSSLFVKTQTPPEKHPGRAWQLREPLCARSGGTYRRALALSRAFWIDCIRLRRGWPHRSHPGRCLRASPASLACTLHGWEWRVAASDVLRHAAEILSTTRGLWSVARGLARRAGRITKHICKLAIETGAAIGNGTRHAQASRRWPPLRILPAHQHRSGRIYGLANAGGIFGQLQRQITQDRTASEEPRHHEAQERPMLSPSSRDLTCRPWKRHTAGFQNTIHRSYMI
jgi:hypothetical protein